MKGSELIFISRIKRDGSGVEPVDDEYVKMMQEEKFNLQSLSLTQGTFIASSMNSFVVKKKSLLTLKIQSLHKGESNDLMDKGWNEAIEHITKNIL